MRHAEREFHKMCGSGNDFVFFDAREEPAGELATPEAIARLCARATGGFKCFRREVLEAINLDRVRSNGYAFQIEMSFRAWKRGFRIAEIPIVFVDRTEGESKMSGRIVREAVWMVWRLRWWAMTGRY